MCSLQSCTAATLLFSITCRIRPCQGDLPDFAFCNTLAIWSHCRAAICMHTVSAATHPARPVDTAVTACCVTAAAGWAAIPTQGSEHLHGAEVNAPKNLGTNVSKRVCCPNMHKSFLSHTWCCIRHLCWANCNLTLQPHTVYIYSTADVCIRLIVSSVVLSGTSRRTCWSGATVARLHAFHESVPVQPRAGHF